MFLLLVLVPLQFFHSVSCGWLPFWGSPAGYSFPNGRPSGKRSSSSYRPGGRRRFIGVRGVGSFSRTFGFPGVGAVSFRTISGGFLSLHWQAWMGRGAETWVVEVLRLGYCLPFLGTPHIPLFPSQCLLPAPSPSRGLLWRRSPWAWLPSVLWSLLHSLLQASTAICS